MFESTRRPPTSEDPQFVRSLSKIIDIGGFKDVVRRGEDVIRLGMIGTIDQGNPFYPNLPTEVSFAMDVRNNSLSLHKGQIKCPPAEIEWVWYKSSPDKKVSVRVDSFVLNFSAVDSFHLIQLGGYETPAGSPSDRADDKVTRAGEYLAAAPVRLLNSLHPVHPLRGFEEWGYPLPEEKPYSLDRPTLGERAISLAGMLAYDRDLEERVSQRLTDLLSIRIKVRLVEGKRVTMWAEPSGSKGADTLFVNEGTGANQLPFILIPVALTPRNQTVLLSEPEAHLHPKGQCELMRMLLTVAKKENIQFFIETHSEHVLHVILNAVARGDWAKDDVALHYFENVEGTAQVKRLGINEHGQVDGGLPGFFDQSLAELTEYLGALGKR